MNGTDEWSFLQEELEELNAVIVAETSKFSENTKTTEETIRAKVAEVHIPKY
jgi:hypothetical protein